MEKVISSILPLNLVVRLLFSAKQSRFQELNGKSAQD